MLWFEAPQGLVCIVQTKDRLPCVNGLYHGYIASDLKEHWHIENETWFESPNGDFWQTRLIKINKAKLPTKEELAAVDAVKKAEESLKAAKKSLELIKENK